MVKKILVVDDEPEIVKLVRAYNDMAESLAQAEVQRRNMVADIAHELRTKQYSST